MRPINIAQTHSHIWVCFSPLLTLCNRVQSFRSAHFLFCRQTTQHHPAFIQNRLLLKSKRESEKKIPNNNKNSYSDMFCLLICLLDCCRNNEIWIWKLHCIRFVSNNFTECNSTNVATNELFEWQDCNSLHTSFTRQWLDNGEFITIAMRKSIHVRCVCAIDHNWSKLESHWNSHFTTYTQAQHMHCTHTHTPFLSHTHTYLTQANKQMVNVESKYDPMQMHT